MAKRTYQATLPGGRVVTRNTSSFRYRFIGIADIRGESWAVGGWSETESGAVSLARRYYPDALSVFACHVELVRGTES